MDTKTPKKPKAAKKPGTAARGKGRPTGAAAAIGADAVLDAARVVLQRLPPTRIKRADLAREAGVHPALINYYFGNQPSLINEVILRISDDLAARREANLSSNASFSDRLRQRIRGLLEVLAENPHLHELLLERVVYGEAAAPETITDIRTRFMTSALATLTTLIDEGVASGECRPIDYRYLYIALIGMCEFPINAFPLFSLLMNGVTERKEVIGPYTDFLVDLLVNGLAPRTKPA